MSALFGLKGADPSSSGQLAADSAEVPTTSATLPEAAAIAIVPVASGAGSVTPLVVPPDSWIGNIDQV